MESLPASALKGLLGYTSSGKGVLLCMFDASYIADIPVSEDLFSINIVNQAALPCHICEAEKKFLSW